MTPHGPLHARLRKLETRNQSPVAASRPDGSAGEQTGGARRGRPGCTPPSLPLSSTRTNRGLACSRALKRLACTCRARSRTRLAPIPCAARRGRMGVCSGLFRCLGAGACARLQWARYVARRLSRESVGHAWPAWRAAGSKRRPAVAEMLRLLERGPADAGLKALPPLSELAPPGACHGPSRAHLDLRPYPRDAHQRAPYGATSHDPAPPLS